MLLNLFEVVISSSREAGGLLSEEVLAETMAQVMTLEEAAAAGFNGMQPDPKGRDLRFVAVAPRDAQFIQRRLEANPTVLSFRVHEVDV